MKRIFLYAMSLFALFFTSCTENKEIEVIPFPAQVEMASGNFNLAGAQFYVDEMALKDQRTLDAVTKFAEQLTLVTGKKSNIIGTSDVAGAVLFTLDKTMAPEEYSIEIAKDVQVKASSFNGFFYAIQTMKQMLPVEIYGDKEVKESFKLPCSKIVDSPRFAYRGMHLDCARHFFSVDEVKKYLDIMSIYKLNTFHWHLTEDQGWRLEIKKYPKLTQIGAYRKGTMIGKDFSSNDNIRYGGYYTQEEVKDVVKYADNLGITIIPEIDLPGHMLGALAAYPDRKSVV